MKLGDRVKSVTEALGIEQCESCKERQHRLNKLGDWLSSVFVGQTDAPSVASADAGSVLEVSEQERTKTP